MATPDARPRPDRLREVFAGVGRGDLGVANLYAGDAVVLFGENGRVEGREEIRAFYRRAIDGIRPRPVVEAVLEAPPLYVALVDVPGAVHHRALDVFEIDDRGIRRLEIYMRK